MPISHDPCRRGDRVPEGAVAAGTQVQLLLRVRPSAREGIKGVWLQVDGLDCSFQMEPCDEGFRTVIDTSGDPRVLFYRFCVHTDEGDIIVAPSLEGASTAGRGFRLVPGASSEAVPLGFQLTTYDPGFDSPEWFKGSVMYQVFPDRFARGSSGILQTGIASHKKHGWPVEIHYDWNEPPTWGEPYDPVDFFGGSFEGIEEHLDYLQSLGVEVLYLNPVVEARSNHRYNTGDYEQIDGILGTWDDYESLVRAARSRGIRIVLDTVLSHTGAASKYFNLDDSYDSFGAMQGEASPYRAWYDFTNDHQVPPYRGWWGDPTLPEVEEHDPSWQEYILSDGGIISSWIGHGTGGLRLDVADEIPDDVLELIRTSAKKADPESVIIGEVWEDPTTKESYGVRRTYALGRALDSVMNYPLRGALIQFALGGMTAQQMATFLKTQKSNYPAPMYEGLMNLLSSHDVERIRSVLSIGREFRELDRDDQLSMVGEITEAEDARAAALQGVLAAIVWSLPGSPCLYYGDERGMQGGRDPFDRGTFPWSGQRDDCGRDLTETYRELGALRRDSDALKHGGATFYSFGHDVIAVLRVGEDGAYVTVANPGNDHVRFAIDLVADGCGISQEDELQIRYLRTKPQTAFSTSAAAADAELTDGILSSEVAPMSAVVFHIDAPAAENAHADDSDAAFPLPGKDGSLCQDMEPGVGVICHITSVPNEASSIDANGDVVTSPVPGTFGDPARRFVDALADAGVKYWQILPLNPADEYGSPYAGLSAFAGNTHLMSQVTRVPESHECGTPSPGCHETSIEDVPSWLLTYATFTAIKRLLGEAPWQEWPEEYRTWSPGLADRPELAEFIQQELSNQQEFQRQWDELHSYANERGIKIIGDMPIYVSADSADVWAHPEYFMLDAQGRVASEGGVPPDQFAADGQKWGSPVYNWDMLRLRGYDWWLDRFERMFELYDYVRIDHFLGFNSYYAIPAGATPAEGSWHPGPGLEFFQKAYEKHGPLPVIAEDLGIITPEVVQLMHDTGFPGMDVIQFADGDPRYDWHPKPGKMTFTGTHDTQTLAGWAKDRYFGHVEGEEEAREAAISVARDLKMKARGHHESGEAPIVMLPLQDVLELGDEARMNVPGTAGQNWKWQASAEDLDTLRSAKLP